jgi:la-related protein 1
MDNDGYVRLSVIAGFRKIQETTKDINILRDAAMMSHEINVQYGFDDVYLRKKDGWQSFVLKEEERDESAKREQINCYIDPRQQKANPNFMTQPSEMIGSTETLFLGSQSHIPPTPTYFPPTTQYGYPLPASGLSATVPEFAPSQSQAPMYGYPGPSASTDEYPDSEIDTLMVVVKRPVSGENASATENASQTSNGVSEATNLGEQDGDGAYDEARRRPQLNGSSSHRSHTSRSEITWSKTEASVMAANATPSPNMSHLSYTEVRAQALQNRNSSSPSKSSREMTILYRFWSHFLVKSFNSSMYKEFRQFALDDADHSVRRGIEELFKFYERSLSQRATVSWDIINDFVELVKADARHGENHGVDRLKAIINQQVQTPYKEAIRALIDHDLNQVLTHGVGKKNSRSPAAEPYKAVSIYRQALSITSFLPLV